MIIGFDADQDCSHVAKQARANGAGFCCRYLKNLGRTEVAALHAAGLAVVLIWETTAKRALSGAAGGRVDGAAAARMAAALSAPAEVAIYATADWDVQATEEVTVLAYVIAFAEAVASAKYRAGFYANGAECADCLSHHAVSFVWTAGGSAMFGTKQFLASGKAAMTQDVGDKRGLNLGISIDSDVAMVEDFGQWAPDTVVAQSAPPVAPDPVTAAVAELQKALTTAGYYKGEVDGQWGPMTSSAVTVWRHAPR